MSKRAPSKGTKAEARTILARVIAELDGGIYAERRVTIAILFDLFMQAKRPRLAATTVERYEAMLRTHIIPALGSVRADKLTAVHLERAYASWRMQRLDKKKGALSETTVKHLHDLIRAGLNVATRRRLIGRNVALDINAPSKARIEMSVLGADDLGRLLDFARKPSNRSVARSAFTTEGAWYPALAFMSYTGVRRGECLALRWTDLDLDAGTVAIRRSLQQTKAGLAFKSTKTDRERAFTIGPALVAILRKHRAEQDEVKALLRSAYHDDGLVFARADGSAIIPWNFGAAFRDLVRRAAVPRIRLHDLRHTHASLLGQAGIPMHVTSKRLGHSSLSVTAPPLSRLREPGSRSGYGIRGARRSLERM